MNLNFAITIIALVAIVAIVYGQEKIALELTKTINSIIGGFSKLLERIKLK